MNVAAIDAVLYEYETNDVLTQFIETPEDFEMFTNRIHTCHYVECASDEHCHSRDCRGTRLDKIEPMFRYTVKERGGITTHKGKSFCAYTSTLENMVYKHMMGIKLDKVQLIDWDYYHDPSNRSHISDEIRTLEKFIESEWDGVEWQP